MSRRRVVVAEGLDISCVEDSDRAKLGEEADDELDSLGMHAVIGVEKGDNVALG